MEDRSVKGLNSDLVQAIYQKNFNEIEQAHEELKAHAQKEGPARGFSVDLGTLTGEFCKDFPLLKKAVNVAQQFSFLTGPFTAIIGIAATCVQIVDEALYPSVCGTSSATKTTTAPAPTTPTRTK